MFKIIVILIFFIYKIVLIAEEPILATLSNIPSNEIQKFKIAQNSFYCKPYGVISIDRLYANSLADSSCKKSIDNFYKINPNSRYFALNLLKIKQMYHIEFKNDSCIIYSNGGISYSETLLENGLATLKAQLKDEEFGASFKKAQERAKHSKIGIWKDDLLVNCRGEAYRE